MRRQPRRLTTLLIACALVVTACEPAAGESQKPASPSAPVGSLPGVPDPIAGDGIVDDVGTIVRPVQPQWAPGSDGIGMSDDWGEHPVFLEPPVPVSVLAGPVEVDGAEWYQVYVLPDSMRWPGDFVAWIPAQHDGASAL